MKKNHIYIIGLILTFIVLTLSCKNNQTDNNNTKDTIAIFDKEPTIIQDSSNIYIGYKDLKLLNNLKKEIKGTLEDSLCNAWSFEKSALKGILKTMKKVSGQEAYKLCYQYPCWYKGIVSNDILEYRITIYGGGYITLYNKAETLHFITENESNLFITICNCCED